MANSISVIVPVYNGELTLLDLVCRLKPVLKTLTAEYELVLVNDGSRDQSWAVIQKLSAENRWVRGINLMRNYGQHNALVCGIRSARFATIVTLDDDLQHAPEDVPKLISKLEEGFDVVYGTPEREPHGLWRAVASKLTKFALQRIMGVKVARSVSAFRALRTRLRAAFGSYQSPFVSLDVLLTWGTTRFAAIRVPHHPRAAGRSNYTLRALIIHALTLMTGFSVWPLQVASVVGFGFTVFGVLVFAYVVTRFLTEGRSVPGFPFLASLIAIFSGAQMFALGIMGEYLARMHFRMMERPTYVVWESTGDESDREKEISV
ncbi:MAG: glycosyltransferase family 2 protein [Verrucomicrobia bacterium]|nr:glycosyltransferase family 2 protein [Verrucomicrobiota bacterium]